MRVFALLVTLLYASGAHALGTPCDPKKQACGCDTDGGCWDLVDITHGGVLGVKGSATLVHGGARDRFDGGALTTYFTEHYGTRDSLSGHALAAGSIGAGSAGTEGSLDASVDFGFRLPWTPHAGAFLRGGSSGMLLGHRRLYLSMLEPVQLRGGYQILDGDLLLELGLTTGLVVAGCYDPDRDGNHSLARSPQLGGYMALHLAVLRVDASLSHLPAEFTAPGSAVDIARLAVCGTLRPVVVCADALSVQGDAVLGRSAARAMRSLYVGLGVGLMP